MRVEENIAGGGEEVLKRITRTLCTIMLITCMLLISTGSAQAASDERMLDGSYLTRDEESIGYATPVTRGVDLLTGYSKCVRRGPGQIYVGGTTIAAHEVENVRVGVAVERAKEGDTAWEFYDGWQKGNHNTNRASISKSLEVEGGYYYRVRSLHSANEDVSSSFTDGIFIEKP